jgi:hypothetical protein
MVGLAVADQQAQIQLLPEGLVTRLLRFRHQIQMQHKGIMAALVLVSQGLILLAAAVVVRALLALAEQLHQVMVPEETAQHQLFRVRL